MNRIKITLPENFSFTTSISIRITDLNYGGHVGNDSFLSIIHEARLQFLKNLGYSELNIEGISLIMADAAIEFKAELFYGDVVIISIQATDFSKLGFNLFYLMEKNLDDKTIVVGKVKTGMLCINYETRKLAEVPQAFIDKFIK
ncbi:MAG: thioesterase family protein [Bacteroidetes bacterium]|jgi:YbgC/YbaW family acyl-CoA thioester hydrolase|nr:thioesterase family protein [Bacteroidota bacterium]